MWLRIEDVKKEDVRVVCSLKCRWDYRHFWGHMNMLLFIALESEVLANRNFFCCSILLASVRDLIKQLRVPADNRSLEGMHKSSWRLDKVHVPVLHMKCGGCWKMCGNRGEVSLESQSCQTCADTWTNRAQPGYWPVKGSYRALPNFQCLCVPSALFWQLFGNAGALKESFLELHCAVTVTVPVCQQEKCIIPV